MSTPITTWAEDDRPREKMLLKGKNALSDAELIAILIGSGNRKESAVDLSKRILADYNNDLYRLGITSLSDLQKYNGIGEAKAISIAAALELGRRRKETERKEVVVIGSSQAAFEVLRPYFQDLQHEEFWTIHLNRANRVLVCENLSKGGIAGTVVDPKLVFKRALELQSSSIILAHNHPSGNLRPSQEDINITKKLAEGGKILDINIFDHLILSDYDYFSFADDGLL
jgi:DNA repair protein RadC